MCRYSLIVLIAMHAFRWVELRCFQLNLRLYDYTRSKMTSIWLTIGRVKWWTRGHAVSHCISGFTWYLVMIIIVITSILMNDNWIKFRHEINKNTLSQFVLKLSVLLLQRHTGEDVCVPDQWPRRWLAADHVSIKRCFSSLNRSIVLHGIAARTRSTIGRIILY